MPRPRTTAVRDALATAGWCLAILVVLDLSINVLWPPPTKQQQASSELQRYFDYGRSIEGKLRRLIGPTDGQTGPLAFAGWIEPAAGKPAIEDTGDALSISVYGMSFSDQVAAAMKHIDPRLRIRTFGGPSAPASHSLAMFQAQRDDSARIAIMGILAGSVHALQTTTGITWNFESPAPYTYPRYYSRNDQLQAVWPEVRNLEDFRQTLRDPAKWQAFLSYLAEHDRYFDRFIVEESVLDASALARMARRAYAQRRYSSLRAAIETEDGFTDEVGAILNAIARTFAETARAGGSVPLVLLLQDGTTLRPDALFRLLGPRLMEQGILFVSTHDIAPASDRRNFVTDGHFTPEANQRIAQSVLDVINKKIRDRARGH